MKIPLIQAMKNASKTLENHVNLPLKKSQDFNGFWIHSDIDPIQT